MARTRSVLTILAFLTCAVGAHAQDASLNPCAAAEPDEVTRDGPFSIGLAYWPGGTPDQWGNATAGLHPCYDAAGTLGAAGVVISAFQVKVDTMTVMRSSRKIESELFQRATPKKVMSVIAFACVPPHDLVTSQAAAVKHMSGYAVPTWGIYRSEPTIVWSDDDTITSGVGVVDTQALIADFDKGKLRSLQWADTGCTNCLGQCVQTQADGRLACATSLVSECGCDRANGTACTNPADNLGLCHTGIQLGASGTDKNSKVFKSGLQIQRMRDAALSSLYNTAGQIKSFGDSVTGVFGR